MGQPLTGTDAERGSLKRWANKMTTREAEKAIRDLLAPHLSDRGFREIADPKVSKCVRFVRRLGDISQLLSFGGFVQDGSWRFTFVVGISAPALVPFLRPEDEVDADCPLLVVPAHLLSPSRKYFDFVFGDDTSPEDLRNEILSYFDQHVARLLKLWTTAANVFSDTNIDFKTSPFVLSSNQTVEFRAALLAAQGRPEEASAYLRSEIASRPEFPPKYRAPLNRILRRIENAQK